MSQSVESDILMYFVQAEGTPAIAAESASTLGLATDTLMAGFVDGRYFEIENFGFNIELADDEGGNVMNPNEKRSYGRWRGLKPTDPKPNPPFRAEPQDVSISRQIDTSSPVLLKYCLDTKRFDQAVIVKRSRVGGSGALAVILRLEFRQVFIRAIEWEDGDTVRETCKFKFGLMKAIYVKRKPDGTLDSQWPCEWAAKVVKTNRYDV